MSQLQAAGQRQSQTDDRLTGDAGHCLAQRGKNDDRGICENGDGDEPAGDGQCPFFFLFADSLDKGICHPFRTAGLFQNAAHHDAKADDDAGAFQGAAEAVLNGSDDAGDFGDVRDRHSADQTGDNGCHEQCNKGMYFRLADEDDHKDNADRQTQKHSSRFIHEEFSFLQW